MNNFWQNDPSEETYVKPFTLSIYKYGPIWLHSPLTHPDPSFSLLSQTPKFSASSQV